MFGTKFASTSRVPPDNAKIQQESPQTRPDSEKGSKKRSPKRSVLRGKKVPSGCTNASRGHFLTFWWSDVLSECNVTHCMSFPTPEMNTFGAKSDLFLRPAVACVHRLPTKNKTREFLPLSHSISWLRLASQMPAERVSVLYFRL